MSTKTAVLALRLQGPMQSWGFNSQFNRRDTALFPTKSALAGLCCAAMGIDRGSDNEKTVLKQFAALKLLCVALPQRVKGKEIIVKRILDYHTVQYTVTASGKRNGKQAVLTYRQYLNDASFMALLEGDNSFLKQIADKIQNPVWGVWLGRKSCAPSAPIFAGVYLSEIEAINNIPEFHGKSLKFFSHTREVASFGNGVDSYMDQPVSFDVHGRKFAPRRVLLQEAEG